MLKLLLICFIYATVDAKLYFEDYCWRDYSGILPSDALQGGLDRNGSPIYIGQVLYDNKLIPGKIPKNGGKIYYEWNGEEHSTIENVKILCTGQPQKFEWISTKSNEVHQLTNTLLIKGGFEPNYWTYIGRILADGETSVGKVICMTSDCPGLYITDNGKVHTPLNVVNAEEIPDTEEVVEDDDSTTHTLDRLSSAATCLVAGVEYTHGQQIYRDDPCEFCLCLDGEMFCWWQDCPPTLEGPCRDRLPFSPCANGPRSSASPKEIKTSTTQKTSSAKTMNSISTETTSSETTESSTLQTTEQSETSTNTQSTPQVCIVMGKEYQIGASLPHDTGNCVECICGPGAQVTCSPHQCAPPGDDINDYRPPGPRPPLPDTF